MAKDTPWKPHTLFFSFTSVVGIDGQRLKGKVMRRMVDGKPQYRAMTEDEESESFAAAQF